MRLIVLFVLVAVLVGTLGGYITGAQVTRSEEDIFRTFVEHIERADSGSGRTALVFDCNGKRLARYDVDSGQVVASSLSAAELEKIRAERTKPSIYDRAVDGVVGSITGGTAVAFGKPLVRAVKSKENIKYAIPAFIAGITGFYLGYEIAITNELSCHDQQVLNLSKSEESWKLAAKEIVSRQSLAPSTGVKPEAKKNGSASQPPYATRNDTPADTSKPEDIPTEEELNASVDEDAVAESVDKDLKTDQITSTTFHNLDALGKGSIVKPAKEDSFWWRVISVYIPVFVLICAAVFAGYILARQTGSAVRRARTRRAGGQ
jgi:hypothetical protein